VLRITPISDQADPYRIPDLVLDGYGVADLAVNSLLTGDNPGDFQCGQGLRTQVIIALLTDARVETSELRSGDENRGWIGDTFDTMAGETPIGSKLWLLRRSSLYDGIEIWAELYARMALKTLIDQGACVRVDVKAASDRAKNTLTLDVSLYGRDGAAVYQDRFELLWRQVHALDGTLAR
jgi:phage gp46-like protein